MPLAPVIRSCGRALATTSAWPITAAPNSVAVSRNRTYPQVSAWQQFQIWRHAGLGLTSGLQVRSVQGGDGRAVHTRGVVVEHDPPVLQSNQPVGVPQRQLGLVQHADHAQVVRPWRACEVAPALLRLPPGQDWQSARPPATPADAAPARAQSRCAAPHRQRACRPVCGPGGAGPGVRAGCRRTASSSRGSQPNAVARS